MLPRSAWIVPLLARLLGACGDPSLAPTPDFAAARPGPVIRLVEREAKISGEARADDAVLAEWSGEQLAPWQLRGEGSEVLLSSPPLDRIHDVGTIELEIAPGGADRLDLIPTMHGDTTASIRRARRIEVPLEQKLPPDIAVRLRIDVTEAIGGNMRDTVHEPQLVQLELTLLGAIPAAVRLQSVRLLRRDAVALPFAARPAMAEIRGRLHPSWWVRGDSAAEIDLDLPAGEPELRWFAGAIGTGEVPRVHVLAGDTAVPLDVGGELSGEPTWRARRASLSAFAGRRVQIRLSNAGSGIALFGDPRVVVPAARERASDVLVYLIDTLRADHIGAFGAPYAGITPNLDRLIEAGVGFEMALSHSPWTKPSVATLLTGLLPTTHRVGSRTLSDRLPATVSVLPERFRHAGWRAGSFAANPLGSTLSGLERGFGTALAPRFWRRRPALGRNPSAAQVRKELLGWIDEEPDRPFFAYVHLMEVHPSGREHHGRERPEGFTAYATSVRTADADLGALLDSLAERGRLDDLLLVVLSDHGDSFGGHGWRFKFHGTSLFQDQIHVPVVFWHHRESGRPLVRQPAGLADVAPTLLALFDLPPLEHADGTALDVYGSNEGAAARSVSSALIRFPHAPNAAVQHAMVDPSRRKVLRIGNEQPLAYDLRRDPGETGSPQPRGTAELLRDLDQRIDALSVRAGHFRERHGPVAAEALDAGELQRLRALGYIR